MTDAKPAQTRMRPHNLKNQPLPSLQVRVWDAPTRLFHWAIVALLACSWYSADSGLMKVHLWSGSLLLTLLLFRIAWGFLGSTTARFSNFLHLPPRVFGYFKALMSNNQLLYAGHNPAGGLMVTALITLLLAQVATGLLSNDGIRFNAPLALWVSADMSDRLTKLHGILFNTILLLVWIHLVAVFFYLFVKKENLIKPMITGYKHRDHLPPKLNLKFVHWAIALVVLAAAAAMVGSILFL
jgi:cytochrome b